MRTYLLGLFVMGSLVACDKGKPGDDAPGDGGTADAGPPSEHLDIPVTINRDLDILFVIDDSPSMADKQQNLADNLPNFVNVLNTVPGGLPNVHVGVVTTDMGTSSQTDPPATMIGSGIGMCAAQGKAGVLQLGGADTQTNEAFLSDTKLSDGTRMANFNGDLSTQMALMVKQGQAGCGFEQPLAAMKKAFEAGVNAGFRRPDAHLAVVIVTDEDDCSAEHAELFEAGQTQLGNLDSFRCTHFGVICDGGGATTDAMDQVGDKSQCHENPDDTVISKVDGFATSLKALDEHAVVAVIGGTPTPVAVELRAPSGGGTAVPALAHSCAYTDTQGMQEFADPGVRLQQFADKVGNGSTYGTVCQLDLSGQLQVAAQSIARSIGSTCFEDELKDADPNTPGDQFSCTVNEVVGGTSTPLDECDATMSNRPCWHIASDPETCPDADHLSLKLEADSPFPPDAHIVADCLTDQL